MKQFLPLLTFFFCHFAIAQYSSPYKKVHVNFGLDISAPSPWNNALQNPVYGSTFNNLKDENNFYTGINIELTSNWGGAFNGGAVTGDESGIISDLALKEYYWFGVMGAPEQTSILVSGLSDENLYNFVFIGSSVFRGVGITDNGSTAYSIGSETVELYVEGNTQNYARIAEVASVDGEVEIILNKAEGAPAGYINALIVEVVNPDVPYTPEIESINSENGHVKLSWKLSGDASTIYQILRSESYNGSYELIGQASATDLVFQDNQVLDDQLYFYKLKAVKGGLSSSESKPKGIIAQSGNIAFSRIYSVFINFNHSRSESFPWNNVNATVRSNSDFLVELEDNLGRNSGMELHVMPGWGGSFDQGAATSNNSGVVPDNVLKEYYWVGGFTQHDTAMFRLEGMDPRFKYDITFIGSSLFRGLGITDNGSTSYRIGTETVHLDVEGNTQNKVTISDATPNAEGNIDIVVSAGNDAQVAYLNALIIDVFDKGIPAAPGALSAEMVNEKPRLVWQDNSNNETSFEVYRSTRINQDYNLIHTNSPNTTVFTDESALPGQTYFYKVRAFNHISNEASSLSDFAAVNLNKPVDSKIFINFTQQHQAPEPWINTLSTPVNGLVFSNLTDSANNKTGLVLELGSGWGGSFDQGAVTADNSGIIPDNALKEYYWFGIFSAPNEAFLRLKGLSPDCMYNFRFIGSSVFAQGGITDNGHTIYSIGSESVAVYTHNNVSESGIIKNVLTDEQGEALIKVTKGTDAPAGYLNALIIERQDFEIPYSPTDLSAEFTGDGVKLNWNIPNDDYTRMEIYRSLNGDDNFTYVGFSEGAVTEYEDISLDTGNYYYYKVQGRNEFGRSGFSNQVRVYGGEMRRKAGVNSVVYVNFTLETLAEEPWNNFIDRPQKGNTSGYLFDDMGNNTSIAIEYVNSWGGVHDAGAIEGTNAGVVPDNVLKEYIWFGIFGAADTASLKLINLNPNLKYNVGFVGSSNFSNNGITDNGSTRYAIGEKTASLYVHGNTEDIAWINNVAPSESGEILVACTKVGDSPAGYLNALVIEIHEYNNEFITMKNGLWHSPVWQVGMEQNMRHKPYDGDATIVEKEIILNQNTICNNLAMDSDKQGGRLIIDGAILWVRGQMDLTKDKRGSIRIINNGKLVVNDKTPKIVCIGNSITHGNETTQSYRYRLWRKLINAGVKFDFVGSQQTNYQGSPEFPPIGDSAFDSDHEGHWGWRTDEIAGQLPHWLEEYDFDIALVHLGTNDALQSQSHETTEGELRQVISILRADNPNAIIFLALLIPNRFTGIDLLNQKIEGLATELNTVASPVIAVDQYADFNVENDTYDGLHPNEAGEEKMASKWFEALKPVIEGSYNNLLLSGYIERQ